MGYDNRLLGLHRENDPTVITINLSNKERSFGNIRDWCMNKWPNNLNSYMWPMDPYSYFICVVFASEQTDAHVKFITNNQEMAVEFTLTWG